MDSMTRARLLSAYRSTARLGTLAHVRLRARIRGALLLGRLTRLARTFGRRNIGADRTRRIAIASTAGLPAGAALMTAQAYRPAAVAWLLVAVVLAAVVGQWTDPNKKARTVHVE